MARALWISDFEWRRGYLLVRQTGARVPFTWPIIKEVSSWLIFYVAIQPIRLWSLLTKPAIKVAFTPAPPRPWYLLWAVARLAGLRFVSPERADAIVYFEDTTQGGPNALSANAGARRLNFAARDVSKSHVGAVFEKTFGYPLAVDPSVWRGPAVEKSELNGKHDGRVVNCPCDARPDLVYQRLIDNAISEDLVEDLRCPTVGGDIPVVFRKRRPKSNRFANVNSSVAMATPEDVFTADERSKLAAFSRAMGLDWGGLDVLRNRDDGRLYVVDVNKTDMGPPTALGLWDKIRATHRLARTLRRVLASGGDKHGQHTLY